MNKIANDIEIDLVIQGDPRRRHDVSQADPDFLLDWEKDVSAYFF